MEHLLQFLAPILLVAFVIFRRVRKSMGFQPFKPNLIKFRIAIFSIISFIFLYFSAQHPLSYVYDLAGILLGGILVAYAMKNIMFEFRENVLFYRTHLWIELFIIFLFLSRLVYRMITVSGPAPVSYDTDPATLLIFFLLAVYYIGFNMFVLRKGKERLQDNEAYSENK
ncbi:sporulation protein [Bacillus gobiensis]|uniref:sporulation protein n=1 Tax=Bacillus gobiensis TaxID=1441095 RepID=UPI003D1CBF13